MGGTDRSISKCRTMWGTGLTIVWIGAAFLYGWWDWEEFKKLQPNTVGDFCAGFAAPLAFFWLVIGYLQQGEELELQRQELSLQRMEVKRLVEETEQQRKAIEANELHARRDTFMRYAELMIRHQAQLAAALMPATSPGGHGTEMAWTRFDQGDSDAFFGAIIEYGFRSNADRARHNLQADPVNRARALQFLANCETLFVECDKCDTGNVLRSFFELSMMASVYAGLSLILDHRSVFKVRSMPDKISEL